MKLKNIVSNLHCSPKKTISPIDFLWLKRYNPSKANTDMGSFDTAAWIFLQDNLQNSIAFTHYIFLAIILKFRNISCMNILLNARLLLVSPRSSFSPVIIGMNYLPLKEKTLIFQGFAGRPRYELSSVKRKSRYELSSVKRKLRGRRHARSRIQGR